MLKKSFVLAFIVLTVFINNVFPAPEKGNPVSSIKINNQIIAQDKWDKIVINPEDVITFYYSGNLFPNVKDKILFKASLNGKVLESVLNSIDADSVSIKGLTAGEYIFRFEAYTAAGWESEPFILKFTVKKFVSAGSELQSQQTSDKARNFDDMIVYAIIAFCLIQFVVIIILFFKKKPEKADIKFELGIEDKYNELKVNYRKLIAKVENMRANALFFRRQIDQLRGTIKDLETANLELLKQRDKLLYSKEKLELLQIKKNEMFAMAVHDIKNPAGAIQGYIQLLESYDLNATEQKEIMQSLIDTSAHIVKLAHDMAIVVAKEEPETVLNIDNSSIKKIIDAVCIRNSAYAKSKSVKLINNSSPSIPDIMMDAEKIEEVVENLVGNAIKFAPPKTIVQVRSFLSGNKVVVEVIDNGVGLSETDLSKIFAKGQSLTPKPTGDEKSSGLGLWIVKKIIDDHNGNVNVKSKPGVGSTFSFELPSSSNI